jgi:hypothetical protein
LPVIRWPVTPPARSTANWAASRHAGRRQAGLAQVPVLGEQHAWRDQFGQLPGGHVVGVGDGEHLRVSDGGGVDRDVPQDGQVLGLEPFAEHSQRHRAGPGDLGQPPVLARLAL